MARAAVFFSSQRRKLPLVGSYFVRVGLSDLALIQTLVAVAGDLISSFSSSNPAISFERRNSRSLVRKVKIFSSLFQFFLSSPLSLPNPLPSSARLCFKELYILIYKSKVLLDYCSQSSRLWLLLQNTQISGHFYDLNLEISTLLDVLPLNDLNLVPDVREQIELLQRQAKRTELYVDAWDDMLRRKIFAFLGDFEKGQVPDFGDLQTTFVDGIGIRNARTCAAEIEFLEEQIYNQEEEIDLSVLNGVAALTRYCRFLFFGLDWKVEDAKDSGICKKSIGKGIGEVPKDFCCPVSLDLMHDPVVVSSGQTYDRASISKWIDKGHSTCPNSGQMLIDTTLVPNRALRSLISQWCAAQGVPYDPPDTYAAAASKAALEANRATVELLVRQLSDGLDDAKTIATRELRLLAKTGRENRAYIAEAGAIPLLQRLLSSSNPVAEKNAITAILNLSILDKNKRGIIEEQGCLRSIVEVLRHGCTTEARENAAATLFSLSAVHDYKKKITGEEGAVEALAGLLKEGSPRGKKDAVTALFNLSTHVDNCKRMVDSGAALALVGALGTEGVAEDAAGALALLVRQRIAAEAVGGQDNALVGLVGLIRRESPRGKENAVAALLDMCRNGGPAVLEKVARAPSMGVLLMSLLVTGTKRARRKAVLLTRMCQSCEPAYWGGWVVDHTVARSRLMRLGANVGADVSVSVSMPSAISVPVP